MSGICGRGGLGGGGVVGVGGGRRFPVRTAFVFKPNLILTLDILLPGEPTPQ